MLYMVRWKLFTWLVDNLYGVVWSFFYPKQLTNFRYDAAIYLLSLIAQYRQKTAKMSKDLLNKHFDNSLCLFILNSESFSQFSTTIYACHNPNVSAV